MATISGTVTDGRTRAPFAQAWVGAYGLLEGGGGALYLQLPQSQTRSASDGSYRLSVPVVQRYGITCVDLADQERQQQVEWEAAFVNGEAVIDLELP